MNKYETLSNHQLADQLEATMANGLTDEIGFRLRLNAARIAELETSLKAWMHTATDSEYPTVEEFLEGLPDAHAFKLVWAFDVEQEDGRHVITAGQIRRAARALKKDTDT